MPLSFMKQVGTSTGVVSSWLFQNRIVQSAHVVRGIFEEAVGSLCIETLQDFNRTFPKVFGEVVDIFCRCCSVHRRYKGMELSGLNL